MDNVLATIKAAVFVTILAAYVYFLVGAQVAVQYGHCLPGFTGCALTAK